MKNYPYLIVGASIAGLSAVQAIRSRDLHAPVLLIHGEDRLPYKRTELSKRLGRGFSGDELALHSREWYSANKIELRQGVHAVALNPRSHELSLANGEVVGYQRLLLATGAVPITLDLPGAKYVQYLRWIDQAERLALSMKEIQKAVLIGLGVQSVELADQFNSAGIRTTLLGYERPVMADHVDPEISGRLEARMAARGIRIARWGKVAEIRAKESSYLVAAEGGDVETELVIASIGATSANPLALAAAIPVSAVGPRGVKVGPDMKSENEDVYAAGDGAAPLPGSSWGLWHAAELTGTIAGTNMTGGDLRAQPRAHRLKCEAFGGYLFSLNYLCALSDDKARPRVLRNTSNLSLKVWEHDGRCIAAVMDVYPSPGQSWSKPIGKQLEKLVLDHAPVEDLPPALGI